MAHHLGTTMTPYYADDSVTLYHGDCLHVMPGLPDASVDAIVTDPPYGLGFMGKAWDDLPPGLPWARQCLRVLKPGGHLLAFGGTRTAHRLACAIEDAGFEIRDSIAYLYGSGFPKSLDVSKAIDKAAGAEREVVGRYTPPNGKTWNLANDTAPTGYKDDLGARSSSMDVTAPTTDAARQWQGWGTALKPAHEPIVVARKPLAGTVAANVLAYGTGALNIDAGRIDGAVPSVPQPRLRPGNKVSAGLGASDGRNGDRSTAAGRWPANVVLDEHAAQELDQQSGEAGAHGPDRGSTDRRSLTVDFGLTRHAESTRQDSGGPSRFFYTAKASTDERITHNGTAHPTVKPLDLMRWLVRLVTPPGGTILEPFAGSGTTVEAALLEGFRCIAIEREPDYLPLITQRINRRRDPIAYITAAGEDLGLFGVDDDDEPEPSQPQGRWPANVVLDRSQAEALDQMSGELHPPGSNGSKTAEGLAGSDTFKIHAREQVPGYADNGGASRFFKVVDDDFDGARP